MTDEKSPITEVLALVDHLIARGAVALEVVHLGTSVKCNLEPRLAQAVSTPIPDDDDVEVSAEDKEAARIMLENEYFRDPE